MHGVVLAAGCGWLYLFLRFLPMYEQRMNAAWSACGAVFTWAAICAGLARVLNDPDGSVAGEQLCAGASAPQRGLQCAVVSMTLFVVGVCQCAL